MSDRLVKGARYRVETGELIQVALIGIQGLDFDGIHFELKGQMLDCQFAEPTEIDDVDRKLSSVLRAWEFWYDVEIGPRTLRFSEETLIGTDDREFWRSGPGGISIPLRLVVYQDLEKFPEPPRQIGPTFWSNLELYALWQRYLNCQDNKEPIPSYGYALCTYMEHCAQQNDGDKDLSKKKNEKKVAARYQISDDAFLEFRASCSYQSDPMVARKLDGKPRQSESKHPRELMFAAGKLLQRVVVVETNIDGHKGPLKCLSAADLFPQRIRNSPQTKQSSGDIV